VRGSHFGRPWLSCSGHSLVWSVCPRETFPWLAEFGIEACRMDQRPCQCSSQVAPSQCMGAPGALPTPPKSSIPPIRASNTAIAESIGGNDSFG